MIERETDNIEDRITGRNVEILPGTPHFSINLNPEQVQFLSSVGSVGYKTDEKFYWRRHFRPTKPYQVQRLTRETMGILAVSAKVTQSGREWYSRYFVDPLNRDALDATNISGWLSSGDNWAYGPFRKILEEGDVEILRAVSERDNTLRQHHGQFWTPSFHSTEIAKLAGISPEAAKDAMPRLAGIMARKVINAGYTVRNHWFIPPARRPDVEVVLAQF